ncbi:MAG: UDP-N-acetylmuramoyl-tripeptide--D-alanyl-D-alanine ligase [Candidatus Berkelbacteria bacterium]|nr:UDP-N-acetylmuramoyl-tripeptide--D-alanyl-D-alanine ligase [Candidatus Berkelbacteria bacterium]
MKEKVLNLIQNYLGFLARLKVKWAKPKIIAITGSYGKTSAKEAVFQVLSQKFGSDVGKNYGNMNSVLGLPLAILGLKSYNFGAGFIVDLARAKWGFFFHKLPKILVLELGIDKPGEMAQLLRIITPDISVITGISETHLEKLKNIETVRREKELVFKSLPKNGVAMFSADDENSRDLDFPVGVKKISFGKNGDIKYKNLKVEITGTNFDLEIADETVAIKSKLVGEHLVQNLLIAAAAGKEFGISAEEIKTSLEKIKPQPGRMNPLKTKNQMLVLDDSYNSNPFSAQKALQTLKAIDWSGRRVAILGNMNELGNFTTNGHLLVGEVAGKSADLLIFVGPNAKLLASGAEKSGMPKNKIKIFATTDEAIKSLDSLLVPGDIILIKASQNGMRFENIVKYLLDDENLAKKVLVRQEKKWRRK